MRWYGWPAWALMCAAGSCAIGCSSVPDPAPGRHRAIDGVAELSQPLSDLTAQCSYSAATHVLALTLEAGDIAVIGRASNGTLVINDQPCGGATAAAVRQITVGEATSGDQTLILDYGGGLFATGTAAGPGVVVDLGAGAGDALKLVGTTGADSVVFGATGIAINADGFADITAAHVEQFVVSLDDGNDSFSGAGNATTGAAFPAALTVYGGAGDDTLRGGAGDDALHGGAGNDTFTTGAIADGNDTLLGDAGTDTADYTTRTAALTVTLDDVANDGAAGETDNVGGDIEILKGGSGDDTLTGSSHADTIYGGPGNDTITGGAGNDTLYGDAGNDTFDEGMVVSGADVIHGGAGTDTVSYAGRTNTVTVTLDAIANDGEAGEADEVMPDVENVTGGAGNDTITGSAADNVLAGGPGNDTIAGGAGNDTLIGGPGDDTLSGDAGDDTFDEGAASDGADVMLGGAGIDRVDYSARTVDLVIVMDGVTGSGEPAEGDRIGSDIENLIGGSGADSITGNLADNQLEGGPGSAGDALYGLAGDDVLDGGGGDDILDCGAGDADIALDLTVASIAHCEL